VILAPSGDLAGVVAFETNARRAVYPIGTRYGFTTGYYSTRASSNCLNDELY
jgi:hypothetical protein